MDLNRRQYLGAMTIAGVTALAGCAQVSGFTSDSETSTVDVAGGPEDKLPSASEMAAAWNEFEWFYIAIDTGAIFHIKTGDDQWTELDTHLANYAEAELPPSGATEGLIGWNATRAVPFWYDGNDVEYPVVGDDVLLDPVTVTNTTTETLVWDAGVDEGSLKVGRTYEISLFGEFSNASTSDMVTLNFYIAGTLVGSVASTGKNASNAPWRAKMIFTVRDAGGSGTIKPHTIAKFNQEDADDHHGTETVDTTIAKVIEVKAKWNNAKAGNSATVGQAYMKEIS